VAVVDHANHALAADFHFDANGLRARVDGILEQLFDDNCGRSTTSPAAILFAPLPEYAYPTHPTLIAAFELVSLRNAQTRLVENGHPCVKLPLKVLTLYGGTIVGGIGECSRRRPTIIESSVRAV